MDAKKLYVDQITGRGPFRRFSDIAEDNIILISMDMVPRDFYLDLDYPVQIATPHLTDLKKNHIFFSNAYCSSPLCSPSRASYLSGRYSYITGNRERFHDGHRTNIRADDILFPEYLKSTNYLLRHIGKCHVGARKFIDIFGENDSPWDRWSPPWFDDDQYTAHLKSKGFSKISFNRSIRGKAPSGNGFGNFYGGWVAPQSGQPFPKEATYPAYLVEKAISALKSNSHTNQPFYFQLDFFGPHQPFAIPSGMEDREQQIRQTAKLPDSYLSLSRNNFQVFQREPRVYRMYRKNWGMLDPAVLTDYIVANQLQFELIDEMIGRLFHYLKETGSYDNSWIFVVADHGEMNGEMGLIDKGSFLNPAVIQVPLYVKPPLNHALGNTALQVTEPVSLLDIAPTVLEITGISTEARLDGYSLLETARGNKRPKGKFILFDIWSHVMPNPAIGMVFSASDFMDYMFTFNTVDDIDELYRLQNHRGINNIIDDKNHADILEEAIKLMVSILESDDRWKGYCDIFKLSYSEKLANHFGDRQHFE